MGSALHRNSMSQVICKKKFTRNIHIYIYLHIDNITKESSKASMFKFDPRTTKRIRRVRRTQREKNNSVYIKNKDELWAFFGLINFCWLLREVMKVYICEINLYIVKQIFPFMNHAENVFNFLTPLATYVDLSVS